MGAYGIDASLFVGFSPEYFFTCIDTHVFMHPKSNKTFMEGMHFCKVLIALT